MPVRMSPPSKMNSSESFQETNASWTMRPEVTFEPPTTFAEVRAVGLEEEGHVLRDLPAHQDADPAQEEVLRRRVVRVLRPVALALEQEPELEVHVVVHLDDGLRGCAPRREEEYERQRGDRPGPEDSLHDRSSPFANGL
ncbi:MAG: hypothetical protein IPN03_06175 [Holophagales bacterium]|nr:hypothetical protein [Holophagales bacterium]